MLSRILLRVAIGFTFILMLASTWVICSFLCGTSLLMMADAGVVTSEMLNIAMTGGTVATILCLITAYWIDK